MKYRLYRADCIEWLKDCDANSFEAIVTDPPYGVREFTAVELEKMRSRSGGIWRIPMRIGGYERKLMPRFTALTKKDILELNRFFLTFGESIERVMVPGAHMIVASTALLSHHVISSITQNGIEYRGTLVRIVRTLRGGDRPKGAEDEFPNVSSIPRGCWEPWLIFRKPLEGTIAQNLRKWKTGGLRRLSDDIPFMDLIQVGKTPRIERDISRHPSVKPQELMRYLVKSSLPLGEGKILDPFAGCGSTLAAAEHLGIESVGIEIDETYYRQALDAIPKLAALEIRANHAPKCRTPTIDDFTKN